LAPRSHERVLDGRVWAADTGCFNSPEKYTDAGYLAWLGQRVVALDRCLFATAPDVVGDAWSRHMLPRIRSLGYRAALVAQDGIEDIAIDWDAFDVLFVGGTTDWKLSERAIGVMADAKRRGKWVHAGRVNSLRRLRLMQMAGADSADGTFVAIAPRTNIPRMEAWLRALARQPPLFTATKT
jgi:hypothetical protein